LRRKGIAESEWREIAQDRGAWRQAVNRVTKLGARITRKCRSHLKNAWAAIPKTLIGKRVEKRFGRKYFVGMITDADTDSDTHEKIWHVRYDDSDSEDCTEADLQKILCDDFNEFEAIL
jgi:hypothetical protein